MERHIALPIIIAVFILAFTSALAVNAKENSSNIETSSVNWLPLSDNIFAQAKQQKKLILLDITASWCKFCEKMKQVTYQDKSVLDTAINDYILVRVDESDTSALVQRYKSFGRPTTVVFNSEGEELIKRVGYIKPQWMTWMLQAVAQNPSVNAHQ